MRRITAGPLLVTVNCILTIVAVAFDIKFEQRLNVLLLLAFPIACVSWYGSQKQAEFALLLVVGWIVYWGIGGDWIAWVNRALETISIAAIWYCVRELRLSVERGKISRQTDEITEVLTRRCFLQKLSEEMERSRRYQRSLTVVIFDINNFHEVNEAGGQAEGDKVLRMVATTVRDHLRFGDCIGRIGADEFAVLLPETDNEASEYVIQKMKQLLVKEARKNYWPIGFSFGAITFGVAPSSIEEVLDALDEVMAYAKKDGKNHFRHDKM